MVKNLMLLDLRRARFTYNTAIVFSKFGYKCGKWFTHMFELDSGLCNFLSSTTVDFNDVFWGIVIEHYHTDVLGLNKRSFYYDAVYTAKDKRELIKCLEARVQLIGLLTKHIEENYE